MYFLWNDFLWMIFNFLMNFLDFGIELDLFDYL